MSKFEESAKTYLVQWITKEEKLFKDKRKAAFDPEWTKEFMDYFMVSRNFPKKIKDRHAEITRNVEVCGPVCNVIERVTNLSNAIAKLADQQSRISAASKLLWAYDRDNVAIYDSRARNALKRIRWDSYRQGSRMTYDKKASQNTNDYRSYFRIWNDAFSLHEKKISKSLSSLSKSHDVKWFRMRVFDIWLWNVGGNL